MKRRNVLLGSGLALVAAPGLQGCWFCYTSGECGRQETVGWNGLRADGGVIEDGGFLDYPDCSELCPQDGGAFLYTGCAPADAGLLRCYVQCIGGRAPPGLLSLSNVTDSPGSWVARMAELEAAAVHAFWGLANELEAHGIDGSAARRAADDEVRHARAVSGLALRMGFLPRAPRVQPLAEPRPLAAIAIENAAEGCGREAYGAAVNAWQAEHAGSREVREVMRAIAPDELQHATLSRELDEVLAPRLNLAERRRAREARELALSTLAADEVPERMRAVLGLPDARQVRRIAQGSR